MWNIYWKFKYVCKVCIHDEKVWNYLRFKFWFKVCRLGLKHWNERLDFFKVC